MVKVWQVSSKEIKAKTGFSTYLGLAMRRINTRQLTGKTDKCSGSVCCWIGGIR
jgi:hypothetical protein